MGYFIMDSYFFFTWLTLAGNNIPMYTFPIHLVLRAWPDVVEMWTELVTPLDSYFGHVVGRAAQVVSRAKQADRRCYHGRSRCAEALG
jgi:hypothetical protein